MDELLVCEDLKGYYQPKLTQEVKAVDGVSFSLKKGEVLGIAGESGCGKSTLSHCLMRMFNPPLKYIAGKIFLRGKNILEIDEKKFSTKIRGREITYIPQSAMNALNPTLKIKRFIWHLMHSHFPDVTYRETQERARERIAALNLPERVLNNYACELSGGMKQRVIVMISTLLNPTILIADEPTSALDVSTQKLLVKMFYDLINDNIIKSLIFITHDLTTLRHACDRIAIMYAGQLVEIGTVDQIIFYPVHPYTRALISAILVPEPGIKQKELLNIPGQPPDLKEPPPGCRFAPRCLYSDEDCQKEAINWITVENRPVRCLKVDQIKMGVVQE